MFTTTMSSDVKKSKLYGDEDLRKKVPRRDQQNLQTDGQKRTSEYFDVTATDATSVCDNYYNRTFTAFTEEQRSRCVLLSQRQASALSQ